MSSSSEHITEKLPRERAPLQKFDPADDPAAWRTCRIGVVLTLVGAAIAVATSCMLTVLAETIQRGAMDHVQDPMGYGVLLVASLGAIALGSILHLAGQVMCCFSPAPYHKSAVNYFVGLGITILAAVAYVVAGIALHSERLRPGGIADYLPVLAFAVVVLAVVTFGHWLTYLHGTATRLGSPGLAVQCKAYMVVILLYISLVVGGALGWLAFLFRIEAPQLLGFLTLVQIGVEIWYVLILAQAAAAFGRGVNGSIGRQVSVRNFG